MSMINDALRRASSAARGTSSTRPMPVTEPVAPPSPPPMPSAASAFPPPPPLAIRDSALPPSFADEEPAPPHGNKVQLILAVVLVLAVGIVAVVNYWEKNNQKPVTVSANDGRKSILPDASAIRTATETLGAITNRAARAEQAFPSASVTTSPAPAAAPKPAAVAPVAVTPNSPPPKFPPLRLQSIYYRPSNPSVMINGRTLYTDDEIQGVKVADIQPASVTLVLSGYTNVLTLR